MRAITLRQPWAWAVAEAGKDVENRVRNIAGSYRGPLAIHAGLGWVEEAPLPSGVERPTRADLAFGAVVAVAVLHGVHAADECGLRCSAWAMQGHHHLEFGQVQRLGAPVAARGALGLWRPPPDLVGAISNAS